MTDRIEQAITVSQKLSWEGILRLAVAGLLALIGIYAWRNLDEVVPALLGSTIATIGVSVALALVAIGVSGSVLMARQDRKDEAQKRKGEELEKYLLDRLDRADAERKEMQTTFATERQEMTRRADASDSREEICNRRLRHVENQLRNLGGQPPESTWGSL